MKNTTGTKSKPAAIVLVSGGMDSLVTLAMAAGDYKPYCLHLNYGQRTQIKELDCFSSICDHYGVKVSERMVVDISYLAQIGGSSLTDHRISVPEAVLDSKEIPNTYVPFRNAHILSIAVSWGEVIGAEKIFIGAVSEDSSGYPDTRREFYDAFEKVIKQGTRPETKLTIETPVIKMKKSQIVRLGAELKAPFEKTWSCYTENDIACGVCDSCALRLRGFAAAKVHDPLPYAKSIFNSETFV